MLPTVGNCAAAVILDVKGNNMAKVPILAVVAAIIGFSSAYAHEPHVCPEGFPDAPIL